MGGGHGGNNGVRDIIATLGRNDFARLKIGADKPKFPAMSVSSWVLKSMSDSELEQVAKESFPACEDRLIDWTKQSS